MTSKSISIKGAERRSGGCVRKAVVLTSGDLHRVLGKGLRGSRETLTAMQESAEGKVARGSRSTRSGHSPERGETAWGRRAGNGLVKARTVPPSVEGGKWERE